MTITIASTDGAGFKGFLLSAFAADDTAGVKRFGTFSPPANAKTICSSATGGGVTHTDPTTKNSITVTFNAPPAGQFF